MHLFIYCVLLNVYSYMRVCLLIQANVGERVNENQFIRIMVTAIIEDAVIAVNDTRKLRREKLVAHYSLLQRYIDNKEQLELQCLFALQALVHKWEHPSGLLLSILERFWEDNLLSTDSFLAWEKCNDPAEQEGKGMMSFVFSTYRVLH